MVVAETDSGTRHSPLEQESVGMDASQSTCTPEEAFVCNQCMQSFVDRDTLFKHVKMEHQQHVHARRKFKCEQCQRTFKSMTGLRNHARTHPVFFGVNADGSQHAVTTNSVNLRKNNLIEEANTTISCTMNSTFVVETDGDNVDINNLSKALTEQTVKSEQNGTELGSRGICDSHYTGSEKYQKRRSGIPLPVRRSLLSDNNRVSPNELNKDIEQTNGTCESTFKTPTKGNETRKSRRLTRTVSMDPAYDVNENVPRVSLLKTRTKSCSRTPEPKTKTVTDNKLAHKSPFGARYRTRLCSPVTPRCRSQSNKRTPQKGNRTPNNGTNTPLSGRLTPCGGKGTPVHGKRTPHSAKKDAAAGKAYNCKKCGKSFVDSAKLEVHFAVHIRDTPEKCGIPKYALKKTANIQKSDSPLILEPCTEGNKSFSCKQCGHTYAMKKYLEAHMKIHDVNTPYSCDFCDKKFRFMSSLKAHSFVHQGESRDNMDTITLDTRNKSVPTKKPALEINSAETEMKFNIFSVLSTDENSLEDFLNDLPFTCKTCSFKTRAPAELLSHMKTHSKSGHFSCKHCSKSYKLQKNLKLHEKIHTINKLKQILIDNVNNKTSE